MEIQESEDQRVVTTGPYAIVRHPMYSALIILYFAFPIALGSIFGLIPGLISTVLLIIRTTLEDNTLKRELPGYIEYTKKTRYRLIPGIW